jgi:ABC-2 type transport system ATP-binding protein
VGRSNSGPSAEMLGAEGAEPHYGIRVEGLEKDFSGHAALRGVDLEVPWGAIVALLGANGAGKSTLLRILGTTVLPSRGRAAVAGNDVVAHPAAARRCLGLVLGEERSWYWRLSGRDNLEFFAALQGLRRSDARARAGELLAEVGLAEAADRRFDRYSSGMRARLSLARALLCEPPVLLLDEPTRTMDPVAASAFRGEVRRQAAAGRAILFATHDLHEAAAIASRVVVMADGRVAAIVDDPTDAASLEETLVRALGVADAVSG